jgi:hypothetical protein
MPGEPAAKPLAAAAVAARFDGSNNDPAVGRAGHGSNQDLAYRMARIRPRVDRLGSDRTADSRRPRRLRWPWGQVASAVVIVLASAGELRARDIHAAVEAVLNEDVSPSSVKNCLATYSRTADPMFERVGRGRYRLA